MNSYTEYINNSLSSYSMLYPNKTDDVDKAFQYLIDKNTFRPFRKGLNDLFRRISLPDMSTAEKCDYLVEKLHSIGSTVDKKTIVSWFSGAHRPNPGNGSRTLMYELCFALNLSLDDIDWLAGHVWFSRSFNLHKWDEAVYFYCLKNGLSYETAKRIIEEVRPILTSTDESLSATEADLPLCNTSHIEQKLEHIHSTDELIKFLIFNKTTFNTWNITAVSKIKGLHKMLMNKENESEKKATHQLQDLLKDATQKGNKTNYTYTKDFLPLIKQCGLLVQYRCKRAYSELGTGFAKELCSRSKSARKSGYTLFTKNLFSLTFLLEEFLSSDNGLLIKTYEERELVKNAATDDNKTSEQLHIIDTNFPDKKLLSSVLNSESIHTSTAYDSIRKILILLASHVYWYESYLTPNKYIKCDTQEKKIQVYTEVINVYLRECGYSELYSGNPYDWIFLVSSANANPPQFFNELVKKLCKKMKRNWKATVKKARKNT